VTDAGDGGVAIEGAVSFKGGVGRRIGHQKHYQANASSFHGDTAEFAKRSRGENAFVAR
jgi:hypothetical protein